jgi:hypothetical protein
MCVACLCADADDFSSTYGCCLASCLAKTKFFLRVMKNCQHQHKGKTNIQEKFQGTAISVEDTV